MTDPVKVKTDFRGWKNVFAAAADSSAGDFSVGARGGSFYEKKSHGFTYAAGVTSKKVKLTDGDIRKLIDEITKIWREEASRELSGTDLQDYLRSIKVEFVKDSIRLTLTGWEALSKDLGWSPHPEGMVAGIGKYDGQLHDMKPMILAGASKKVVPMRLQGTKNELKQKLMQHLEQGLMQLDSQVGDPVASIDRQVSIASAASKARGKVKIPKAHRFREGPGPIDDIDRPGRKFTKSLLEGAKGMGSSLKAQGTRANRSSFFVFRTVSDGTVKPPKAGKKKKMTKKEKLAAMRARNMRYKWLTRGREPRDIISRVQDIALKKLREVMTLRATTDAMKRVT